MRTFYKPVKTLLATAVGLALATSVMAGDMARDSKNTKSQYDTALRACGDTQGAERDACRKEARAKRDRATSEARAQSGPLASGSTRSADSKSTNETAGSSTSGLRKTVPHDSNMASPKTPKAAGETAGAAPGDPGMTQSRRPSTSAGSGAPVDTPKSTNESAKSPASR